MKAITLHEPWASLIACGLKKYETRSWTTRHRGLIAIHAAAQNGQYYADGWQTLELLRARFGKQLADASFPTVAPFGCIVAVATLKAVFHTEAIAPTLDALELAVGNFEPGRAAWQLVDVHRLNIPIPARGAQGLWEWTPPVEFEAANEVMK
ncbi:MAG: ASCH domain-containing protein [Anaerolineae bacterium]|nr:ASCH domain-containing protein [Anaerolineae bacterium]